VLSRCALGLLTLLALTGCAGNWLVLTAASYHENRERGYNERNLGLGLEVPMREDVRAIGGTYRNSHDRQSWYAGGQWTPIKLGGLSIGAAAVAASGYEDNRLSLFAAPMVSYEARGWGINLTPFHTSVIGLQFKAQF